MSERTAADERRDVVRLLRHKAQCHRRMIASYQLNQFIIQHSESTAIAYEMAADAIEAGEHAKEEA